MISRGGKAIREHRWIMQEHIGRKLKESEHIHHKNGDKLDNRIENLEIITNEQHRVGHAKDWKKKNLVHYLEKKNRYRNFT